MRALDSSGTTTTDVNMTGIITAYNGISTVANLVYNWNVWEVQIMVLLSLMLQVFLFFTGILRCFNSNRLLRLSIWLAYLGADWVAIYTVGLFSQYEGKYKAEKELFGDDLPFLWVPFLLVHLGGQDSITAFSMEDNNLWLRHLLNLVVQGILALYAFWKSYYRINPQILILAMFVFASGIIKYGERIWALKSGSRDYLSVKYTILEEEEYTNGYPTNESYARRVVLLARGLIVGKKVSQLCVGSATIFQKKFQDRRESGSEFNLTRMELSMMYDLLYTKFIVLTRWVGCIFRCFSLILMAVAFVLFYGRREPSHNLINVAISYTLFGGAVFMETCSLVVVMASPWTRAHLGKDNILHVISSQASSFWRAIQCNRKHSMSVSIGQFNYMDFAISDKSKPTWVKTLLAAVGLEKLWRNLWHINHTEATEEVISYIMDLIKKHDGDQCFLKSPQRFRQRLNYILAQPFECALINLHIHTELHISTHFSSGSGHQGNVILLKKKCEMLSNYMIYLMVVYPSLLPLSSAVEEAKQSLIEWVNNCEQVERPNILQSYASAKHLFYDAGLTHAPSPFETLEEMDLEQSLKCIAELWVGLLFFAAGKCSAELHVRQLSSGGELLTYVWLFMLHHGLGDAAREVKLFRSKDDGTPYSIDQPCYAFDFVEETNCATPSTSHDINDQVGALEVVQEETEAEHGAN